MTAKARIAVGFVVTSLVLSGCNDKSDAPNTYTGGDKTDGPDGGSPLLRKVGFTGAITRPERRFAGIVPSANRVTLIDPATESEAFGRTIEGSFDRVVPLPDFSGVALFTSSAATIVGASGEQTFPDSSFVGSTLAVAREAAAYASISADGASLRVIRSKTAGQWQDQTWSLPWGVIPGQDVEGAAPRAIATFNNAGTRLVVLSPMDGRLTVFASTDATTNLEGPVLTCDGAAGFDESQDLVRSVTWDDANRRLLAGDRLGQVRALSTDACADWTTPPIWSSGASVPITDLSMVATDVVGVTQAGGRGYLVTSTEAALTTRATFNTCYYPVGTFAGGSGRIVMGCLAMDEVDQDQTLASVNYSTVSALVFAEAGGEATLALDNVGLGAAGAVIDGDKGALVELRNSAIGILDLTSLSDKTRTRRKGLFLKGILND